MDSRLLVKTGLAFVVALVVLVLPASALAQSEPDQSVDPDLSAPQDLSAPTVEEQAPPIDDQTPREVSTPAPAPSTCGAPANPWGFTLCDGQIVRAAPPMFCTVFRCIDSFWNQTNGYVVQCVDGLFSHSGGVRGACSGHHGVGQPLYMSP